MDEDSEPNNSEPSKKTEWSRRNKGGPTVKQMREIKKLEKAKKGPCRKTIWNQKKRLEPNQGQPLEPREPSRTTLWRRKKESQETQNLEQNQNVLESDVLMENLEPHVEENISMEAEISINKTVSVSDTSQFQLFETKSSMTLHVENDETINIDSDEEDCNDPIFDYENEEDFNDANEEFFDALDFETPLHRHEVIFDIRESTTKWDTHICDDLANIFRRHNTSHVLMRDILHFVRYTLKIDKIPLTPYVILGREKITKQIIEKNGDEFVYIGIKEGLEELMKHFEEIQKLDTIYLDFSWDGIPVFRSSSRSLWPICGAVTNSRAPIFPIAVFSGGAKPKDPDLFFGEFNKELDDLVKNGLLSEKYGKKNIVCSKNIADTPARSFATGTAGHTSHHGCNFCEQEGFTLEHRTVYSDTEKKERTDQSFRNQTDEAYHK